MTTIADKLSYLLATKSAIAQAISDKGIIITEEDTFNAYAAKIGEIETTSSTFPDISNIVNSDTDNVYPFKMIWLFRNNIDTLDYTFGQYVQKVKLSDGTIYTSSFTEHVWDASYDIDGTYRWMILYMSNSATYQKDTRFISATYNTAFLQGKTEASNMFYQCFSLEEIPLMDTSNFNSFYNMFYKCSALKSIPMIDASTGANFSNMFNGCSNLKSLPEINIINGTNFSGAFDNCFNLVCITGDDISIPSFGTSVSFKDSSFLCKDTILGIFNNLKITTGQTITIDTLTNAKLTIEEKEIATNKGWTISVA
jgi:hypothetical protein